MQERGKGAERWTGKPVRAGKQVSNLKLPIRPCGPNTAQTGIISAPYVDIQLLNREARRQEEAQGKPVRAGKKVSKL